MVRGSNPGGRRDLPFPSWPTPRPTKVPVQLVPGLFPGGEAAGSWHWPLPSRVEAKERVELYLYFLFGPSWPVTGRNLPVCNRALCTYMNLHCKPLHSLRGLATVLRINTVAVQSCICELKYCGLPAFSEPSVGNIVCLEAFRLFPATTWPFTHTTAGVQTCMSLRLARLFESQLTISG